PPAELHPGAATGRAPVAAGPRGPGQPGVRRTAGTDRGADRSMPVADRTHRWNRRCGRVPLGRRRLTVTDQPDLVSHPAPWRRAPPPTEPIPGGRPDPTRESAGVRVRSGRRDRGVTGYRDGRVR